MSVASLVEGKQVVICAGSGGVGKTTTSAAIAAGMAERGKKAAVLTIDPARRLADSLGLRELGNEARRVDPARLRAAGLGEGELWALTLDAKRTFDDIVEAHAPDRQAREAILSNPIYRELSNAVAGSQEYMAMEKLHELHQEGRYDLLVLDTPPTRNALDFLEAPARLSRFIDSRSLQFFRAGSRAGLGLVGRGTGVLFAVMKRATGVDLLDDLAGFFNSLGGMSEGFGERAKRVNALLRDSRTTFLLVTSPRAASIEEASYFSDKLADSGLPLGGVIVNRVRGQLAAKPTPALESELARLLDEKLARKIVRNLDDHLRLADRDARNVSELRQRLGGSRPTIEVPELAGDVHDLNGLAGMNRYLFAA
ncbi:MAG: AAA family ATPase [Actinomycetota bacterium]|nr:AAA family ATPase [Actinomycetota bacterium]